MAKRRKRFEKIAKKLSEQQLRRTEENGISLSEDELFGSGMERPPSLFFLGYYSKEGIELALKKYGIYKRFQQIGFGNLQLFLDTRDPYRQRLAIYSVIEQLNARLLLAEIVVRRKHVKLEPPFPSPIAGRNFEMLFVEWMCMQDPRKKFTAERPQLPGQDYPGLGGGKIALELIVMACRRLRLSGVLNVPEYFHNAQMYSKALKFVDPACEGKRQAIERDLLKENNLAAASWAIDLNCVRENGEPFKWFICEQLIPLHPQLKEYFQSKEYEALAKQARERYHYALDEECRERNKDRIPGN